MTPKNKPVYYKEHLIPFGEYTPWWFTLLRPLLPKFNMDSLFAGSNENNKKHILLSLRFFNFLQTEQTFYS
jgi:apolipoprotein N-acyltransferase